MSLYLDHSSSPENHVDKIFIEPRSRFVPRTSDSGYDQQRNSRKIWPDLAIKYFTGLLFLSELSLNASATLHAEKEKNRKNVRLVKRPMRVRNPDGRDEIGKRRKPGGAKKGHSVAKFWPANKRGKPNNWASPLRIERLTCFCIFTLAGQFEISRNSTMRDR